MTYKTKRLQQEILAANKKKSRVDAFKQVFDLLKHMTTLSSGSILLLLTFLEKILHGVSPGTSIRSAFLGFCVSIFFALVNMFFLSLHREEKVSNGEANFFAYTLMMAIMGFAVGIFSLAYIGYSAF